LFSSSPESSVVGVVGVSVDAETDFFEEGRSKESGKGTQEDVEGGDEGEEVAEEEIERYSVVIREAIVLRFPTQISSFS
jgi:hypothetical protein